MITVHDCQIINLPRNRGQAGKLTPVSGGLHLPFDIARIYYLYDVPEGKARGGHAHKKLQQLIIPVTGSFDLILDDGDKKRKISLSQPNSGLYIPGHIWTRVVNFSAGSVCMVLASLPYDENEYIRDYDAFLQFKAV
jgi:oxalate decarboxylase/phosphoglucose isomerase-like protein (cupin superfamily)